MSVFTLLGKAIPSVSIFFINLTLTILLSGPPMMLLRIVPLIIYRIYRGCFSERKLTRRMLLEGPLADNDINYGTTIPGELYIFAIMLLYWVISPILLPICGMIFASHYLVFKYQLLYVIVPENQTGGAFFYKMFNFTMTGLMFSSIAFIGYMAIRQATQTPLLIPLPIIVYVFWGMTEQRFKQFTVNMAHSRALDADTSADGGGEGAEGTFSEEFFIPPELSGPSVLAPEVYRIKEMPLIDEKGYLNEEYHEPEVPPVNPLFTEVPIEEVSPDKLNGDIPAPEIIEPSDVEVSIQALAVAVGDDSESKA
jgi:hypothetical protein